MQRSKFTFAPGTRISKKKTAFLVLEGLLTQSIRITQTPLRAERIPIRRAKIVDFNHDASAGGTQRCVIVVGVCQRGEFIALAAGRAGASSGAGTVKGLGGGGVEAGIGVEAACGGGGVAVGGAVTIAGTVSGGVGGSVVWEKVREGGLGDDGGR